MWPGYKATCIIIPHALTKPLQAAVWGYPWRQCRVGCWQWNPAGLGQRGYCSVQQDNGRQRDGHWLHSWEIGNVALMPLLSLMCSYVKPILTLIFYSRVLLYTSKSHPHSDLRVDRLAASPSWLRGGARYEIVQAYIHSIWGGGRGRERGVLNVQLPSEYQSIPCGKKTFLNFYLFYTHKYSSREIPSCPGSLTTMNTQTNSNRRQPGIYGRQPPATRVQGVRGRVPKWKECMHDGTNWCTGD